MKKESEELLFETTKSKVKMSIYHAVREMPAKTVNVNREKIVMPNGYAHSIILKLNGKHFAQRSEFSMDKVLPEQQMKFLIAEVMDTAKNWASDGLKELIALTK